MQTKHEDGNDEPDGISIRWQAWWRNESWSHYVLWVLISPIGVVPWLVAWDKHDWKIVPIWYASFWGACTLIYLVGLVWRFNDWLQADTAKTRARLGL